MSPTIVVVIGMIAPAPMPWMPRKTMRVSMFQAAPQSTEPTRNIAIPKNSTGFRPNRSDSRP